MIEEKLKEILQEKFDCDYLEIINESHLHAGHASSPESGESHFKIKIQSKNLNKLSRLDRHRAVNREISSLFNQVLHAISLEFIL